MILLGAHWQSAACCRGNITFLIFSVLVVRCSVCCLFKGLSFLQQLLCIFVQLCIGCFWGSRDTLKKIIDFANQYHLSMPYRKRLATYFGQPFVKQFALCYRAIVQSCLSVTLVYCGQTVRWIKVKLVMEVGLGPGHIVLDGDPAPSPHKKGTAPSFWPMSIVAKQLDRLRCHLVWR